MIRAARGNRTEPDEGTGTGAMEVVHVMATQVELCDGSMMRTGPVGGRSGRQGMGGGRD